MPSAAAGTQFDGVCTALFVFDIAQSIDLDRSAARLSGTTRGGRLAHGQSQFQFAPPPLRVAQACEPIAVGAWTTTPEMTLTVFEIGAVCVSFSLACRGELATWIELSCALTNSRALAEAARRRVDELVVQLQECVVKGNVAEVTEDYAIFRFPPLAPGVSGDAFVGSLALDLARLLRSEHRELSAQEVGDALAVRVSFEINDLALIDWNAAIVFDDDPDDVLRVLEFANVELLEMRFLDGQLDRSLDRAYRLIGKRNWRRRILSFGLHGDLDRLSAMQVDASILFERVGNTLKLISDQYLARTLRATAQRFRLAEWNEGILRKLETLDGIYAKVHDHATALRAEFLEVIVIALILAEIALALMVDHH